MDKYSYRGEDSTLNVNAKDVPLTLGFHWHTIIATWFFLGKSPIAPGTIGSLAAFPFYYWAMNNYNSLSDITCFLYVIAGILAILGWLAVSLFQKETRAYDHRSIVVDEVVGQLLTLALCNKGLCFFAVNLAYWHQLAPINFIFLASFALFRFYDIWKPLYIGWVDSFHRYAWAVMLDDILAACFAGGTVYILYTLSLPYF